MKILKGIFKLIIAILIIIALLLAYEKYKEYKETKDNNRARIQESLATSFEEAKRQQEKNHDKYGSPAKTNKNAEQSTTSNGLSVDGESVTNRIKSTYSNLKEESDRAKAEAEANYDPTYLDHTVLLYEGKQRGSNVKDLLGVLIENADQKLFSYLDVTTESGTITYTNRDDYVSRLTNLKDSIADGSEYNISFGYNSLRTQVNEVIINK